MDLNKIIIGIVLIVIGFGLGYSVRDKQTPKMSAYTGGHIMPDGSIMSNE